VTSGIAEINAWDETSREKVPMKSTTLTTITAASDTRPRLVQMAIIGIASTLPAKNVGNFLKLSLTLPTSGPMNTIQILPSWESADLVLTMRG